MAYQKIQKVIKEKSEDKKDEKDEKGGNLKKKGNAKKNCFKGDD